MLNERETYVCVQSFSRTNSVAECSCLHSGLYTVLYQLIMLIFILSQYLKSDRVLKSVMMFNRFSWPSSFTCLYIRYCSYILDFISSLHVFNMVNVAVLDHIHKTFVLCVWLPLSSDSVSYTHLDVYKRQA